MAGKKIKSCNDSDDADLSERGSEWGPAIYCLPGVLPRNGNGMAEGRGGMVLRVTVQIASDEGDMWEAQSRPPAGDEERRSKQTRGILPNQESHAPRCRNPSVRTISVRRAIGPSTFSPVELPPSRVRPPAASGEPAMPAAKERGRAGIADQTAALPRYAYTRNRCYIPTTPNVTA